MKSKLLLLLMLFGITLVQGQGEKNITGKYYVTNVDLPVDEIDFFTNEVKKTDGIKESYIAKLNTKFTVIEILANNRVKIKFWKYSDPKSDNQHQSFLPKNMDEVVSEYNYIGYNNSYNKYFTISVKDLDEKTQEYFGSNHNFTYGITLIPFKIRFGNGNQKLFQYSEGFSLGLHAGYEYGIRSRKEQSVSFLVGIAASTVNVDSKSTNNYIENDKVTSSGAFTPSLGVVYTYDKFQLGAFVGWDIIGGELGNYWIYNKKSWLGLGIGFTIFQKNNADKKEKQEQ